MTTSEAQKRANKKWIINNKEKNNAIQLANNIKFYHLNREKILEKKKIYYYKKKGLKEKQEKEGLKENTEIDIPISL